MAQENFNFRIYKIQRKLKSTVLKKIPFGLIPSKQDLSNVFQIGITTYIDRYEEFFRPLYLSLTKIFPEVDIFVAVNGFFDQESQRSYLDRLCNDLCNTKSKNSTFVLHDFPVGLTRLWNEILCQGRNPKTLLLNDDLTIYPWFRQWLERNHLNTDSITLINGTWSHFFLNKSVIEKVGFFDENFRGIGFEDMDYTVRCTIKRVAIHNLLCDYIEHKDHQPARTSFDNVSDTLWGPKYSSINHEYFFAKWRISSANNGIFIKQLGACVEENKYIEPKYSTPCLNFNRGICYPDRE